MGETIGAWTMYMVCLYDKLSSLKYERRQTKLCMQQKMESTVMWIEIQNYVCIINEGNMDVSYKVHRVVIKDIN